MDADPAAHPDEPGRVPRALPSWVVWPLALTAICWVALGDYLTGADVTFTLLYLAPIAFAAWYAGRPAGVASGVLSAVAWYAMDLLTRVPAVPAAVRVWNLGGQIGVFLVVALLVDAARSRLDREHRLARTDALTGLENRRAFEERLLLELERARRDRAALTVACIDCDGFKNINDRYGHARGDAVLRQVATRLREQLRPCDAVGRIGGDEFALLLPYTDAASARAVLERFRETLQDAAREPEYRGASVGAITFVGTLPEPDALLSRVDALVYAAKRGESSGLAHAVDRAGERVSFTLTC